MVNNSQRANNQIIIMATTAKNTEIIYKVLVGININGIIVCSLRVYPHVDIFYFHMMHIFSIVVICKFMITCYHLC